MTLALQTAVVNYLTAKLAADDTLSGVTYAVRGAVTDASSPFPGERHIVIVRLTEAPTPIAFLVDGMVDISVHSPADVAGITVANHGKLERAVQTAWDRVANPTADDDLNTAIEAALPGWTSGGYYAEGWVNGVQDNAQLPSYIVKVGAVRENA